MNTLKAIGTVIGAIVIVFMLAAKLSSVQSTYACTGALSSNGTQQSVTTFLKLERYRWWVGLWSDSAGAAWVEIPNKAVTYLSHITESGDLLQLWYNPGEFNGNFSTLSGALGVNIEGFGIFEGVCTHQQ